MDKSLDSIKIFAHGKGTINKNAEVALGSAPAPGAVFRALAENLVRTE